MPRQHDVRLATVGVAFPQHGLVIAARKGPELRPLVGGREDVPEGIEIFVAARRHARLLRGPHIAPRHAVQPVEQLGLAAAQVGHDGVFGLLGF